jgi:hypothetical protein
MSMNSDTSSRHRYRGAFGKIVCCDGLHSLDDASSIAMKFKDFFAKGRGPVINA